jgi:hypothetical protein
MESLVIGSSVAQDARQLCAPKNAYISLEEIRVFLCVQVSTNARFTSTLTQSAANFPVYYKRSIIKGLLSSGHTLSFRLLSVSILAHIKGSSSASSVPSKPPDYRAPRQTSIAVRKERSARCQTTNAARDW